MSYATINSQPQQLVPPSPFGRLESFQNTKYRSIFGDEIWNTIKPFAICAMIATMTQGFVIPSQNMKVVLQLANFPGDSERFRSACFFYKYCKVTGVMNLWRGTSCSIQRAILLSMLHLWLLHPSLPFSSPPTAAPSSSSSSSSSFHSAQQSTLYQNGSLSSQIPPSAVLQPSSQTSSTFPSTYSMTTQQAAIQTFGIITILSLVSAPFDYIITKQQADSLLPPTQQSYFRGGISQLIRCILFPPQTAGHSRLRPETVRLATQTMLAREPAKTAMARFGQLYTGFPLALTRSLAYYGILCTLYPAMAQFFPQESSPVKACCYFGASLVANVFTHPLDTIKTIQQATPRVIIDNYGGSSSFLRQYVSAIGFRGLYRGFLTSGLINTVSPLSMFLAVDMLALSPLLL